ncbi:MAG: RteC domain-containing protein [Flavobacteriaceae bacterium]|nr:RteC domain-containing protein [Flavobacteriaceae bacterium]
MDTTNKTIKNALSSVKEKELKLAILTKKEIVQNAFELSNVMKTTLEDIRSVVVKKGFKNEQDEIVFFKTAKPKISGRILFFQEVIKLETHSPENIEQQLKFYDNQIIKCHNILIDNELYNYFVLDRKDRDTIYFLRRNTFLDNRDYGFFLK